MNWTQRPLAEPLIRRLRQSPGFGVPELAALASVTIDTRVIEAHGAIATEGDRGDRIHAVLDGWTARIKILENGSRQIPALALPGDFCDIDTLHVDHRDFGIVALTRCTVAVFARDQLHALFDRHRGLRDAIYRMITVENAIATQSTVSLGRRSARERLAHLLCELSLRLRAVGAANGESCTLPLTQEELADVLGLTAVHVNRTLQALRSEGLIQLKDYRLAIPDWAALKRAGGFDGTYLHIPGSQEPTRQPARGVTPAGAQSEFATA